MYPAKSQFRADGMPEPMPPSAFANPTPKPKPKPKVTPTPKKSRVPGNTSIPNETIYKPVGSGASAWVGGALGGGGGAMGRK